MKKLLLLFVIIFFNAALAAAQTSYPLHIKWDALPTGDSITDYELTVDNTPTQVILPVVDTICNCISVPYTFTVGQHTIVVIAVNEFTKGDAVTITFNLTKAGKVNNVKVTK